MDPMASHTTCDITSLLRVICQTVCYQ